MAALPDLSRFCSNCGTPAETSALSCPSCGQLTHSDQLKTLSADAQTAAASGNLLRARELWTQASSLLPEDTMQYRSIRAHISELDEKIAAQTHNHSSRWKKITSAAAPIAALLWKFKALLLGLTKLSTLLSMFAFFGVYWSLYGWAFALGLVLSIYIHEMGHVIAIRGYGMPASAPMFIPGFGAFIQLRTLSITPVQDARIGLAGPIYGLGAAMASLGLFAVTRRPVFGVIAHFGATINLFNLIPVWQLDGSRGFHSLTRLQRTIVLAVALALAIGFGQGMLFLVAIGATYRLFTKDAAQTGDRTCLIQYVMLMIALAIVTVASPLK